MSVFLPMKTSPGRQIYSIAWPLFISQLAVMAYGFADTVLAGHYATTHLAAVGIGASIHAIVSVSLMGVLQALSPLAGQRYGAGDHPAIGALVRQGVLLAGVLSATGIALLLNPGPLLDRVGLVAEVADLVRAYLAAVAFALPASLLVRLYVSIAPAVGRPRAAMVLNLGGLALKVPLSWALMRGLGPFPELGGPGCAWGSFVAYWVMAAVAFGLFAWHPFYRRLGVFAGRFTPRKAMLAEIFRLGVPIGLTVLVDVTAYTCMALFLARLGPVVSGAHQILANLGAVGFMLPLSIGFATQIMVSQSLGSGDQALARRSAWSGVRIGLGLAVALALVAFFAAGPIVALYTVDPAVIGIAVPVFPLLCVYHVGDAAQVLAIQALRGYHRTVVPLVAFVVAMWVVGLGAGYILAFNGAPGLGPFSVAPLGMRGFWIAEAVGVALLAVAVAVYLRRVTRRGGGNGVPVAVR